MKDQKTSIRQVKLSWLILLAGIFTGMVAFTLYISRAHSYLSDDPQTCMNCHIMAPQYATWSHSSHRGVTNCNDCHVPHNNVLNKYFFKAKDGLRHATIFTMRGEPEVIHILEEGQKVVKQNCIRCHEQLLTDSKLMHKTKSFHTARTTRDCWECHRETPHGRVNSISSVPNARVPVPSSIIPDWINEINN